MSYRIAIIIERADIMLGGAERSVFELSTALSALGHNVQVLAAKGQTNAQNIHILCQDSPGKRVSLATFASALKQYLAENGCDIVHSVVPFDFADIYQPRGGSFAESVLRNADSFQNPVKKSYKKITAFTNFSRARLWHAEKKLCKNSTGPVVAALSEYVSSQFKKHYNLDDSRITVIANGVRTDRPIDPLASDRLRAQIMAELALKEADMPVFFLFVANNFRLKGLRPLIKAMSIASSSDSERQPFLIVAGNGKPHKYRRLAKKLNVHKRIIFLGSVRHIQNALAITDVAVLPTFYDPASRFILEALAAEKPVITTNSNGATDVFVNDRHGKVIETPQNICALAEAVSYFSDTSNIRKAAQAIADDNLKESVSIRRVAKETVSLYESILQKRRTK